LSDSELIIYLLFQNSGYRDFKYYYNDEVVHRKLRKAFLNTLSYTRFVALIRRIFLPWYTFLQSICALLDKIDFINSTSMAMGHNKKTLSHIVFLNLTQLGKITKG
jgi:hypothetical protein